MKAMVLHKQNQPLVLEELQKPEPNESQLLIEVEACGICRTDLHILDGDLSEPKLPLVLGHQIVGYVQKPLPQSSNFKAGDLVGVPWLGGSCGVCGYCKNEQENLCDNSIYTGYQLNGGFAEYCIADQQYCFPIDKSYSPIQAAPLLCAGLIGYRSYRMAGNAKKIGLYGFGSAAHIIIQVAKYENKEVYVFTREDDIDGQKFAIKLGADWTGSSNEKATQELDAAIIFAPVGELVPKALTDVRKGGVVVCAGIHMTDIPTFPYSSLWGERILRSVANLTRSDGEEFFNLAHQIPIRTEVTEYSLEDVNFALDDLRHGRFNGSAVIRIK